MRAELRSRLGEILGSSVAHCRGVSGGDIGESSVVELAGGERLFLKCYPGAAPGMASAEARGLGWLAEARALRTPQVRAHGEAQDGLPAFLALEWIETGGPGADYAADYAEELGRGLAALHRTGAAGFGFAEDNFIGRLPQSNRRHESWVEFYAEERLGAQLDMARQAGRLPGRVAAALESLIEELPSLCGPEEAPARLHGDLWGGNALVDPAGRPCLIDPAVYGGHREVDLAMMRLFGGFDRRVFAAYDEAWPLAPGHRERVDLYQLYPLLVHVNLFGGSYVGSLEGAIRGARGR
ncbi:MAG: fructosamine kinase family protein [Deltaproteobacteria bacterium]|nr:fructosamine kinase family protein [Deltaproteobacteria bacterium]